MSERHSHSIRVDMGGRSFLDDSPWRDCNLTLRQGGSYESGRAPVVPPPDKRKANGSGEPLSGQRRDRRSRLDAGWDRWLDRSLHDLFDPVLDESIPSDLSELLDRFEKKPAGKEDKR